MSTVTVLASPERRRRWTEVEKQRIVEESLTADTTVAEVARRHDIHPNLLHLWRRQARQGRLGATGSCSCRDHLYSGAGMRTTAAVFAPCAARKGRNNRDRTWRLSRAC